MPSAPPQMNFGEYSSSTSAKLLYALCTGIEPGVSDHILKDWSDDAVHRISACILPHANYIEQKSVCAWLSFHPCKTTTLPNWRVYGGRLFRPRHVRTEYPISELYHPHLCKDFSILPTSCKHGSSQIWHSLTCTCYPIRNERAEFDIPHTGSMSARCRCPHWRFRRRNPAVDNINNSITTSCGNQAVWSMWRPMAVVKWVRSKLQQCS